MEILHSASPLSETVYPHLNLGRIIKKELSSVSRKEKRIMIRRMIKIGIILTLLGLALDFTNADAATKYRLNKTTVKVTAGKTVRLT